MSEFTTPSNPKQRHIDFQVVVNATNTEEVSIPSPVNGRVIGFTVRSAATQTDTTITLAYAGTEVELDEVALIESALTYRFNVTGGGRSVERDGGKTGPTANRVLRFNFTNDSAFQTALYVRVDFISAQ